MPPFLSASGVNPNLFLGANDKTPSEAWRHEAQRKEEGSEEGARSPVWGSGAMSPEKFGILHTHLYILMLLASFVFWQGDGEQILMSCYFFIGSDRPLATGIDTSVISIGLYN